MDSKEVKQSKRLILTAFSVVCTVTVLILFCMNSRRPISPQLTRENLALAMGASAYQVFCEESCYLLPEAPPAALCQFDNWTEVRTAGDGKHILTFKLAEQYELAFYENGYAQAYDGYSSSKYRGNIWYQIPENVTLELMEYVSANGVPQEIFLGPESWFVLTE